MENVMSPTIFKERWDLNKGAGRRRHKEVVKYVKLKKNEGSDVKSIVRLDVEKYNIALGILRPVVDELVALPSSQVSFKSKDRLQPHIQFARYSDQIAIDAPKATESRTKEFTLKSRRKLNLSSTKLEFKTKITEIKIRKNEENGKPHSPSPRKYQAVESTKTNI
ncbi:hypothetical protein GN244_ATG01221 [Phytophthora infestans]|uniref:Uncharacterized protein n=1 Tax=Phytophthora infestans TaxID=4787 RepID=A0A833X288_PHYIN|nr:hypothetical protein GN244_ATG01221 [Phytophthora infestans]